MQRLFHECSPHIHAVAASTCTYRWNGRKQRLHGRQHYDAPEYKRFLCKGKVKLPLKKRVECFWTTGIEHGERNCGKTVILRESFRLFRSSGGNLEGTKLLTPCIAANTKLATILFYARGIFLVNKHSRPSAIWDAEFMHRVSIKNVPAFATNFSRYFALMFLMVYWNDDCIQRIYLLLYYNYYVPILLWIIFY